MDELVAYLRRALDAEEQMARAATAGPWWHNPGKVWLGPDDFEAYDRSKGEEFVGYGESPFSGCIAATGPGSHAQAMADAAHIARWDPARVLAEVEAKRRILDECADTLGEYDDGNWLAKLVIQQLAQPYAGGEGWDPRWAA